MKDLILALESLSTAAQVAHRAAVRAGRTDVAKALRSLGWAVAAAIALTARGELERAS